VAKVQAFIRAVKEAYTPLAADKEGSDVSNVKADELARDNHTVEEKLKALSLEAPTIGSPVGTQVASGA